MKVIDRPKLSLWCESCREPVDEDDMFLPATDYARMDRVKREFPELWQERAPRFGDDLGAHKVNTEVDVGRFKEITCYGPINLRKQEEP